MKLGRTIQRYFSTSQYEEVDWLAGCETKTNFIFGAVYFFSKEHDMWNTQVVLDLYHLSGAQQKHSKSQTHVPCYLPLQSFGK